MQLRWTEEAAHDLERIADYLLEHAPDRAQDLIARVYDAPTTARTRRTIESMSQQSEVFDADSPNQDQG
jgi:plasmid stabilization system protein ParE